MSNIIEITDLSAPELDIYARLSENQLLHYYEPNGGLFIAESPKVVERALDAGCRPLSLLLEKKHIDGEAKQVIARCGVKHGRDLTHAGLQRSTLPTRKPSEYGYGVSDSVDLSE